jgi:hypothetical protein
LLFYTAANGEYEKFVPLYIYFALTSNPESYVEVALEDSEKYVQKNTEVINTLKKLFGDQFRLSTVDFGDTLPGAVRFITKPELADKCEYVYISDIDILIFDDELKQKHIDNMNKYDAPFSNIVRGPAHTEGNNYRLSGLHFAPTDLQYPIPDLKDVDYSIDNDVRGADENILYEIMKRKKDEMIPDEMDFRPVPGIHMRTNSHPFGERKRHRPNNSFQEVSTGKVRIPWTGIEVEEYRDAFIHTLNDEDFQSIYFQLDVEMKNMLMVLENACKDRFDQFEGEAFTYIITEAYYEALIRKFIRVAYNDGIGPASKRVADYIWQRIIQS